MIRIVAISATADASRIRLSLNYARSLEAAGLVPLVVPPLANPERAVEILNAAAGLLLTGGEDIAPARYGARPHAKLGAVNPVRDATELALLLAARERRAPVLGICRGIQLLNVALGGTLFQDLPSEHPSAIDHDPSTPRGERTHDVTLTAGSRVAAATGVTRMTVNSYHHQAPRKTGAGLVVTATAPDGVIEALEAEDPDWWALAVQWHPEDLATDAREWDRGIFRAFASEIGRVASGAPTPPSSVPRHAPVA